MTTYKFIFDFGIREKNKHYKNLSTADTVYIVPNTIRHQPKAFEIIGELAEKQHAYKIVNMKTVIVT